MRTLLGLDNPTAARGTITLLAVDFINAPPMASVDELLKVNSRGAALLIRQADIGLSASFLEY